MAPDHSSEKKPAQEPVAGAPESHKPAPAAAKPTAVVKPAAPPPPPFVAQPSMPVSMINLPDDAASIIGAVAERQFPGELDEDFETLLGRVEAGPSRHPLLEALTGLIQHLLPASLCARPQIFLRTRRKVAFDGFTVRLHDEKTERDRRYGTIYTVSEELNVYLVRLEMPRRLPNSALKQMWNLPDEMPDYEYTLSLGYGVLSIHAGVRGEAFRRLSYVSSSFPSEFLTRIEFAKPVDGFKHRLRNKVLEVIIFKREGNALRSVA